MLLACSVLMTLTGAVSVCLKITMFCYNCYSWNFDTLWREVGPFRTVEQSSIASLVPHEKRSDIYAWYTFWEHFVLPLGHSWQEH